MEVCLTMGQVRRVVRGEGVPWMRYPGRVEMMVNKSVDKSQKVIQKGVVTKDFNHKNSNARTE